MQQLTDTPETLARLDAVLRTVQSLNAALATYVYNETHPSTLQNVQAAATEKSSVIVAKTAVLPAAAPTLAPVLTIKLSDLQREGEASRRRRLLRHRQDRSQSLRPQQTPRDRQKANVRQVEVLYRRGFRLVS